MGVDLVLRKNGEYVTSLGRSYHFTKYMSDELDIDRDFEKDIEHQQNEVMFNVKKLQAFVAGSKKVVDEFKLDYPEEKFTMGEIYDTMMEELEESISYLSELAWENSQKSLVGYILMDDDLEFVFE